MTIEGSLQSGGGFDIEQLARDGTCILIFSYALGYNPSITNLAF